MLDHVQKHVRALRALNIPVDTWDTMLIAIIKSKLNQFNERYASLLQRRAQLEEARIDEIHSKSSNKSDHQKLN